MPDLYALLPEQHQFFMKQALKEAAIAYEKDEVPVGAVLVKDGAIIARGHNLREASSLPGAHAEFLAIEAAAAQIGHWRLLDTTLYVTLEPCPMCAGAIINARIPLVVYGAYDKNAGALGSKLHLNAYGFNHTPEVIGGVMEAECSALLRRYFKEKRAQK